MTQAQKRLSIFIEPAEMEDYSQNYLKDTLTKMNRTLYKTKLIPDSLEKLEKEAIRGEGVQKPEPKPHPKPKRKSTFLSKILKSEHKTSKNGTQILKLPKLPFGHHESYNEGPQFKSTHFIENHGQALPSDRQKELDEITRKFRLHEKKYKSSKRSQLKTAQPILSDFAFFDIYETGPGTLVCERQEGVIESYEKHKEIYQEITEKNYEGTFKDLGTRGKYFIRKSLNVKKTKDLVNRLLPSSEEKESELGKYYTEKYLGLFENEEAFHSRRRSS